MIKFIIYDDEELFRKKIVEAINKSMIKNKTDYIIEEYEKYNNKMSKTISDNSTKIYIMDIEIPNSKSGIDVAREIRSNDWNSIIMLVTSHVDMGYDALKAQIMLLDFISKYNDFSLSLQKTIKKAISKIDNKKVLIFENSNMTYKIYTDDIIYILKDTIDRKCVIKTEYNEICVNENISNLLNLLDHRFFLSHRSCIINTEKIDKIDWKKNIIYFKNNLEIDYLSRDKRKGLKEYVRSI